MLYVAVIEVNTLQMLLRHNSTFWWKNSYQLTIMRLRHLSIMYGIHASVRQGIYGEFIQHYLIYSEKFSTKSTMD